ncbi:MAG: 50S ribosomal protein L15 [Alphaproteobacteria bacterium]
MKLNEIKDNKGARKSRMRVARGSGCGKGVTGGRGDKGQKSRSGVAVHGFEGGQMPIYRRLPKRGFNNEMFASNFAVINLGKLQAAVDAKKLDAKSEIGEAEILKAGLLKKAKDGIKVLGGGELKTALNLKVSGYSSKAKEAIEKNGGKIEIVLNSKLVVKAEE